MQTYKNFFKTTNDALNRKFVLYSNGLWKKGVNSFDVLTTNTTLSDFMQLFSTLLGLSFYFLPSSVKFDLAEFLEQITLSFTELHAW